MFSYLLALYASLPTWLTLPYYLVGLISIWSFLLPFLHQTFFLTPQNLKQKYNAEWALVTGGSSGIGEQIVRKLAAEGVNVVIVALDNALLSDLASELRIKYPRLEFRSVGVDLGSEGAVEEIVERTKGLRISLVFNNAGYILPGFFASTPIKAIMSNYNVNATVTLKITHHFLNEMLKRGDKGLIEFTSSSGGFIPGSMTGVYSSTKAFLTNFAATLAAEVKEAGIDVMVVHPSPIASNFFDNAGSMSVLQLVKKTALPPIVVADAIFRCAGHTTVVDHGAYSFLIRMFLKVLDWNVFAELMVLTVRTSGDYKALKKKVAAAKKE
ncbi:hypothetical protein HK104_000402 [Borealophlyctis nickersoniae]|nr:hypothetical protein HK104_000402 [Borealophlyctis nickersoniae]